MKCSVMLTRLGTLVQAYAAARMAESCLLGLQGKDNIYECAYVESGLIPELSYFASKVRTQATASIDGID